MHRYDQSARVYEVQYSEEQETKIQTVMTGVTLRREDAVLDAGCGTGILFEHLSKNVKSIVGTDVSRNLLNEAKKKAEAANNVALVLSDADNMPFPNGIFDAAFAVTLLQNTPDPRATLKEIKRVSKPNATIVVTGLRKAFTQKRFVDMLKQSGLKVDSVKLDLAKREYIAICIKTLR